LLISFKVEGLAAICVPLAFVDVLFLLSLFLARRFFTTTASILHRVWVILWYRWHGQKVIPHLFRVIIGKVNETQNSGRYAGRQNPHDLLFEK